MDALNLYILTFNCARNPVDVIQLGRHFFDALPHTDNSCSSPPPDLIVLCLQEIAPIAYSFLGGSFLTPYLVSFGQVIDSAVRQRDWNCQYSNLVTDNVGMTGLMVFARSDIMDNFSSIDIARVGIGFQEMGNKGAVGARLLYSPEESPQDAVELTFVGAHLAPMENAVSQRNADWRSIVERLVFDGSDNRESSRVEDGDDGESAALLPGDEAQRGIFSPNTYLFLGGDLNYRTSDTSPQKEDHLRFPQADAGSDSPLHYTNLLKEDQLTREMQQSQCFQGLSEAPITFPPTYKYSQAAQDAARELKPNGTTGEFGWTRTRWPSWCDRVLYLESPSVLGDQARLRVLKYDALPVLPSSDHRPVALSVSIPILSTKTPSETSLETPFAIDPAWEQRRDTARRKELVVGTLAYLGWTWEGNSLVVASVIGIAGVWFVIRSLFEA